jgi:xylulokinase
MSYLLGIDAGTTTIKAALFDPQKGLIARASVNCPAAFEKEQVAEIDMVLYWQACLECIHQIANTQRHRFKDIQALCVSSQGVTFVPLDRHGRELRRGIVYYDTRAESEARALVHRFGEQKLYEVTGQPGISALYQAAKLIWLRMNEPECFRDTHKILLVHDYLVFKLTGTYACVPPILSSSLLLDVRHREWWGDMLAFVGITDAMLPQIYQPGAPVGQVKRDVARDTGIPETALVVAGAIDQVCGMIGVGNTHTELVSESTGSVLAVHTVTHRMFKQREAGIHHFCNAIAGTYALIGVCPTAGAALNWFKDVFCEREEKEAGTLQRKVFEIMDEEAEQASIGSDGLVMLPHLTGGGSPKPNSHAKGVFYGIRLHHKKCHFIRAVLESVAFMLRSNLEVLKKAGIQIEEIRSFGGGSHSRLWNQIKADVCALPVVASHSHEPGCLGAAILAGVGSGIFSSIEEGCENLVSPGTAHYPEESNAGKYEEYYLEYRRLNEMLEPMFKKSSIS